MADGDSGQRRPKVFHVNGSFPHYYSERGVARGDEVDPRIGAMRPDWFHGRRCLDIGCHQGNVALAIGRRWCCASIVGIDIDADLIARAQATLSRLAGESASAQGAPAAAPPPSSGARSEAPAPATVGGKRAADGSAKAAPPCPAEQEVPVALAVQMGLVAPRQALAQPAPPFPHNVRFAAVDVARAEGAFADGSFETITCLSTSKWIHLNGGDGAIKALFAQVHRMLTAGGAFVFEPQPWTSYRRKKHVSEAARSNYAQIELRPERFVEYLVDVVGFRAVEEIKVEYGAAVSKGFASRPLFLLLK